MDNRFKQVIEQLPRWFFPIASAVPEEEQNRITELRLFAGQPALWLKSRETRIYDTHILTQKELDEAFYSLCRGSVHSFQREIL
ncbi:MAG: hypothetical protein IJ411_04685, partial [Oscillospiraceae bacterium]|nr:hypothetical protein [Oscillospiraceae bacterium]